MSASLTIALAALLLGMALLYAGWTGRSLKSVLTGNNSAKAAKA